MAEWRKWKDTPIEENSKGKGLEARVLSTGSVSPGEGFVGGS